MLSFPNCKTWDGRGTIRDDDDGAGPSPLASWLNLGGGVSTARLWGLDAQCPIIHEAAPTPDQGDDHSEELPGDSPRSEHHL